jgi:hypothetical protein
MLYARCPRTSSKGFRLLADIEFRVHLNPITGLHGTSQPKLPQKPHNNSGIRHTFANATSIPHICVASLRRGFVQRPGQNRANSPTSRQAYRTTLFWAKTKEFNSDRTGTLFFSPANVLLASLSLVFHVPLTCLVELSRTSRSEPSTISAVPYSFEMRLQASPSDLSF